MRGSRSWVRDLICADKPVFWQLLAGLGELIIWFVGQDFEEPPDGPCVWWVVVVLGAPVDLGGCTPTRRCNARRKATSFEPFMSSPRDGKNRLERGLCECGGFWSSHDKSSTGNPPLICL